MSSPANTAIDPNAVETSMMDGTRWTTSDAVAGGPTRRPNTSRVPIAWKLATMLSARRASSAP